MEMFSYLKEEEQYIADQLVDTIERYGILTRDVVFEKVKATCAAITAHLQKQETLVLAHIGADPSFKEVLDEAVRNRTALAEEVGQLVMVHIDEPAYTDSLRKLLEKLQKYNQYSVELYSTIENKASKLEITNMASSFQEQMFSMTDVNAQVHQA